MYIKTLDELFKSSFIEIQLVTCSDRVMAKKLASFLF